MDIPDEKQVARLWKKYALPVGKQLHVSLVARCADYLAGELISVGAVRHIDRPLLSVASLLHDLDKAVKKLPGEHHPDTAVRLLKEEGMESVAAIVRTHPVHAILDTRIMPRTWEEKVLFLSDKMVKSEILDVDRRFRLWFAEPLPEHAKSMLRLAYPKVKSLESEIFLLIHRKPEDLAKLVPVGYTAVTKE